MSICRTLSVATSLLVLATVADAQSPFAASSGGSVFAAALSPDGLADLVNPSEFVSSEGVGALLALGSIDIEDVNILVAALNADNGSASASIVAVLDDSGLREGDVEDLAARAAVPTPEPSSLVLFASGVAAMGFVRRRRNG